MKCKKWERKKPSSYLMFQALSSERTSRSTSAKKIHVSKYLQLYPCIDSTHYNPTKTKMKERTAVVDETTAP